MSNKRLYRFHDSLFRLHRHFVNAKGSLYLRITHHIILRQLLQAFRIQRQMKQSSKAGTKLHHPLIHPPDMRLAPQSYTHQRYQLICGQGFIIPHMINTTRRVFHQQSFHHIAKIVNRSK